VTALGEYGGALRGLILGFKDRGRYRLARPLGALLAEAVRAAEPTRKPVLLLYVPDTAAAARERYGDHMRRLTTLAAARLRESGRPALASQALTATAAVADSAGLTKSQRAQFAPQRFAARRIGINRLRGLAAQATVLLVDDVVTTGSTLAAAAQVLDRSGIAVAGCAVLAATKRRLPV
jgi:predicted amidophosphoribosyltransferase